MSLANVSIVGNLTRQPEQTFFSAERVKTTLIVAVNTPSRSSKAEGKTADFYKVETWGKLANLAALYLTKGSQVTVSGRLVLDHWMDKQGKERITPVVEASQLAFPPKLRVVSTDDPEAAIISGEIDLTDARTAPLLGAVVSESLIEQTEDEMSFSPSSFSMNSGNKAVPRRSTRLKSVQMS
jgi:single-strand DNA-binding protein